MLVSKECIPQKWSGDSDKMQEFKFLSPNYPEYASMCVPSDVLAFCPQYPQC